MAHGFLGTIFTDMTLTPDREETDHCGGAALVLMHVRHMPFLRLTQLMHGASIPI